MTTNKMINTAIIMCLILLSPALTLASGNSYMRIRFIEGDVQIKTSGSANWDMAEINEPVGEGDQIWSPEGSKVELQLNSGTYIRLDEYTSLQTLSMDEDSSQLYLSQGQVYIFNRSPKGSVLQIDTPDMSTRVFKKAVFGIDLSDTYTDVSVYNGYVETENRIGSTGVRAGSMISYSQDENGEISKLDPPDDWERWNKARNNIVRIDRDKSTHYLPPELKSYSRDFDESGKWVQSPEYGYVWTPVVITGVSWSPYRHGRWIIRNGEYVWVASETWGWVPYHYGRWTYIATIGWVWVPPVAHDVYWGPGYVGWVKTPDYVAWVPLAPGEIYYGRGNYGRNSVNIINININQIKVTQNYHNVVVDNGVTVVNRNSFSTGSPKFEHVDQRVIHEKIFSRENVTIGAPLVHPSSDNRFISNRSIPETRKPPFSVGAIKIEQLKHSRPFIRESDRSVFKPGKKTDSMAVKTFSAPAPTDKTSAESQPFKTGESRTGTRINESPMRNDHRMAVPDDKKPDISYGNPSGRDERNRYKPETAKTPPTDVHPPVGAEGFKFTHKEKKPAVSTGNSTISDEQRDLKSEKPMTFTPESSYTGRMGKPRYKSEEPKPPVADNRHSIKDRKQNPKPDEIPSAFPENNKKKADHKKQSDKESGPKKEKKDNKPEDSAK